MANINIVKPYKKVTLWEGSLTSGHAILNDNMSKYDSLIIVSYNTYYKWWSAPAFLVDFFKTATSGFLIQARNDDRHVVYYVNDTTISVAANFGSIRKIIGVKKG